MPIKVDPRTGGVIKLDSNDAKPFEKETGRKIFETMSKTNLNRSPIINLKAQILAGLVIKGDTPFLVSETTEHLLVDGSIVLYDGEFLKDLTYIKLNIVIQAIRDKETGKIVRHIRRVYERTNKGWIIYDEKRGNKGWELNGKAKPLPVDAIQVFINGEGILYWPQNVFHRIEEIEQTVRGQTGKSALAMYIIGFMGDMQQLDEQLALNPTVISIPGVPGSTKIERVHSTEAVTHLMKEMGWLLERWRDSTFDPIIGEDNAESGVARRHRMKKMLEFIKGERTNLQEIYKPYGVTFAFDKIEVMTVQERTLEYALAKSMFDDKVITKTQFKEKSQTLL